jgi:hypothetical protein
MAARGALLAQDVDLQCMGQIVGTELDQASPTPRAGKAVRRSCELEAWLNSRMEWSSRKSQMAAGWLRWSNFLVLAYDARRSAGEGKGSGTGGIADRLEHGERASELNNLFTAA